MNGDPVVMKRRLAAVNYYRLSAYWHTFRRDGGDAFVDGTDFEVVWGRYVFDRQLRLIVMDAIERFEVAVRAELAYALAHEGGAFGWAEGPNPVWRDPGRRQAFREHVAKAVRQAEKEDFVRHFDKKYGDTHSVLPVWVLVEVLSFGDLVSCFKGSSPRVRRQVAGFFGVADVVLDSWLLTLNLVRNLCAHHGRLWNRVLGVKPKIPRDRAWKEPVEVTQDRMFGVLTLLAYVKRRLAPGSRWSGRVRAHLDQPGVVPLAQMGFPASWQECTIWRQAWETAAAPQP
jgi:abortive infection bacteriophage resistance protein